MNPLINVLGQVGTYLAVRQMQSGNVAPSIMQLIGANLATGAILHPVQVSN